MTQPKDYTETPDEQIQDDGIFLACALIWMLFGAVIGWFGHWLYSL